MLREIDILTRAAVKGLLLVEKETRVSWSNADLTEAGQSGRFQQPDDVIAAEATSDISTPFPACPQQFGSTEASFRLAGQTKHFFIFVPRQGVLDQATSLTAALAPPTSATLPYSRTQRSQGSS